jgi:hypothetical protein
MITNCQTSNFLGRFFVWGLLKGISVLGAISYPLGQSKARHYCISPFWAFDKSFLLFASDSCFKF